MPENRTQRKPQMVLNSVLSGHIAIEYPCQNNNPGKNMKQMRPGNHIEKR